MVVLVAALAAVAAVPTAIAVRHGTADKHPRTTFPPPSVRIALGLRNRPPLPK